MAQMLILVTRSFVYINHLLYFEKKEILKVLFIFYKYVKERLCINQLYIYHSFCLINKSAKNCLSLVNLY